MTSKKGLESDERHEGGGVWSSVRKDQGAKDVAAVTADYNGDNL